MVKKSKAMSKVEMSYRVKHTDGGIIYPTVDKNFYVEKDNKDLMNAVVNMSKHRPQNIMLVGPQGCGKTELAVYFAAKTERPLLLMNCAAVREARDWFGYRDVKDGEIAWHQSDFVRAVSMDNAVILLDEFNRLHTSLHNTLYPLLDARRSSCWYIHDG